MFPAAAATLKRGLGKGAVNASGLGAPDTEGPAAFVIARFGGGSDARLELPTRTLTAGQLFAVEAVTFAFEQLAPTASQALSACFR